MKKAWKYKRKIFFIVFIISNILCFFYFNSYIKIYLENYIDSKKKDRINDINSILDEILFVYSKPSRVYVFKYNEPSKSVESCLKLKQRMIYERVNNSTSQFDKYKNYSSNELESWYTKQIFEKNYLIIDSLKDKNKYNLSYVERMSYVEQDISAMIGYALFDDDKNVIGYLGVDFLNNPDRIFTEEDILILKDFSIKIQQKMSNIQKDDNMLEMEKNIYVFLYNILLLIMIYIFSTSYLFYVLFKESNLIKISMQKYENDDVDFLKEITDKYTKRIDDFNKEFAKFKKEVKIEITKDINKFEDKIVDLKQSISE